MRQLEKQVSEILFSHDPMKRCSKNSTEYRNEAYEIVNLLNKEDTVDEVLEKLHSVLVKFFDHSFDLRSDKIVFVGGNVVSKNHYLEIAKAIHTVMSA